MLTNPRLSGDVMAIVTLTLFMHITERHRWLFISLVVVRSAGSFALIAINSMRGEEIWGRELMETTPIRLRVSGGAPSLWFMESCMRAGFCCCQRQVLDSNQNSQRERRAREKARVSPENHRLHMPSAWSWSWGGAVQPRQPEEGFRLPSGSKGYIEAITNLVCLIFSNQRLSGAVFCVMWGLQVLADSEIVCK